MIILRYKHLKRSYLEHLFTFFLLLYCRASCRWVTGLRESDCGGVYFYVAFGYWLLSNSIDCRHYISTRYGDLFYYWFPFCFNGYFTRYLSKNTQWGLDI